MPPVGDPDRGPHAEAALGEVEAGPDRPPDAVIGGPPDVREIDSTLEHQVLDEPADLVVGERGDDRRPEPEAAPKRARDVVLAAAFPHLERTCGRDTAISGIEAQHDFAQADEIPLRASCWLDFEGFHVHFTDEFADRSVQEMQRAIKCTNA